MVLTLELFRPSFSLLLASKKLEKCSNEATLMIVLNILGKFQLSIDHVLMLITDGVALVFVCGLFA